MLEVGHPVSLSLLSLSPMEKDTATPYEPRHVIQEIGLIVLLTGILSAAVAWTGFRRGQRWAWYFMFWLLAFAIAVDILAGIQTGIPIAGPAGVLGPALLVPALLLPYRKFFPNREVERV